MSTARRTTTIVYSGGVDGTQELEAALNAASPAMIDYVTLSAGHNTIAVPSAATAVTIVPPTGNAIAITLKGSDGDETLGEDRGIRLHNTDPATIAIDSATTTFRLHAAGEIEGLRMFWS